MKRFRRQYRRPANEDQSKLGTTWSDVEGMIRRHAFPRWAGRLLAVLVVITVAAIAFGGWNQYRVNSLARAVQSGAITSCLNNNAARATNKMLWDEFLTLAVNNPQTGKTRQSLENEIASLNLAPAVQQALDAVVIANWSSNPGNLKLVQGFEAYIASHEASQACTAIFNANGATPAPGTPSISTAAVTGTVIRVQAWNGYCLTAASASAGTRVSEVPCADSHWWVYYTNGWLSLQGHPSTALADAGGIPELRSTPTSEILTDTGKNGPEGFFYQELCTGWSGSCVSGTYLHSNGNGKYITFDGVRGDLANYYVFLVQSAVSRAPHIV
jgi:hypothetical protein